MSYILTLISNVFRKKENTTTLSKDIIVDIEVETNVDTETKIQKHKEPKKCAFCKEIGHDIRKCEQVNNKLEEISNYFLIYENQVNIPKAKEFLETFDKLILNIFESKYKIKNYMCNNCSVYYDNNIYIKKNQIVELLIGYLCVLPLHPEIKIKRNKRNKINKHSNSNSNQINRNNKNMFDGNVFITPQGLSYGIKLM